MANDPRDTQSRFYFTSEQLLNSPSRKNGMDADQELQYRQRAANLIQDMGQRLHVYENNSFSTDLNYRQPSKTRFSKSFFSRHATTIVCLLSARCVMSWLYETEAVLSDVTK